MVNDGKARIQPVKVSRQIGGEVVIADGIKADDIVLTEIPQAIAPGVAVQIADADGKDEGKGKGKGKGRKSEKNDAKGAK
jgi:hypothetical protein